MVAEWKEHVVRITYTRTDGTVGASSGYALSPRRVLTALHVAYDEDARSPRPDLRVGLATGGLDDALPVSGRWPPAYQLEHPDVAVLSLDTDLGLSDAATLPFHARYPNQKEDWATFGFPSVAHPKRASPDREPETASGYAEEPPRGATVLELNATTGPRYWNGLSGAPIVCNGAILGVVQACNPDWRGKVYATPMVAILRLPDFLKACGLAEAEDDPRVRDVEEEATALLAERSGLTKALATSLDLAEDTPPDALVHHLLHVASAVQAVRAINEVDDDLAERRGEGWSQDRAAARALLWLVLPLAVDWRRHRQAIEERLERGDKVLELPFFTGTVVECVLAGVERREARPALRFDAYGNRYTAGPGAVQQPPELCCHDISGDLLLERVAKGLAPSFGCSQIRNRDELIKQVADGVRVKATAPRSKRRHYYFLFVDIHQEGDAESGWQVAMDALSGDAPSGIPFLRLIRLTGTAGTSPDEREIALNIDMILESATPKEPLTP